MSRYYGDQNKTVLLHESGTYANTSGNGVWIGLVTNNDIDDNMNIITTRYMGTASRNIGRFDLGPQDFTGTLTYWPQDFRLLGFALGSIVDGGSPSPYTHVLSEINNGVGNAFTSGTLVPFMSFTLEDSKTATGTGANFIRTYRGCVIDSWELKGSQGGLLEATASWIGQSDTYTSGATTAVTEDTNHVPYKWSHVLFHLPSGTTYPEMKSFTFRIGNSFNKDHYLNGSLVIPTPGATDRDYTFNAVMDMEATRAKTLYDSYFLGGSTFNAMLMISASAGSQDGAIIMSGCKLVDMPIPSQTSVTQEMTVDIRPQVASCNVNDLTFKYNPW